MNGEQTLDLMEVFVAAYGREITNETLSLWANVFSDSPFDQVAKAAKEWVENESRFPTPADIKGLMRQAARRASMEPPPARLPEGGLISGPEGGFQIAYRSYCREVERQGRTPRPFDEFCGKLTAYSQTRRARR